MARCGDRHVGKYVHTVEQRKTETGVVNTTKINKWIDKYFDEITRYFID